MAESKKQDRRPMRATMLAISRLERMGLEPIDELVEAMRFAKEMTMKGGNVNLKGDTDQAAFVGLWIRAAESLARFKHPVLAAVAVQDVNKDERKPITTVDAINIIKSDPFAPKSVKELDTERVIEAMNHKSELPLHLPAGIKDVK